MRHNLGYSRRSPRGGRAEPAMRLGRGYAYLGFWLEGKVVWYRERGCGNTLDLREAYLYSAEDARNIAKADTLACPGIPTVAWTVTAAREVGR